MFVLEFVCVIFVYCLLKAAICCDTQRRAVQSLVNNNTHRQLQRICAEMNIPTKYRGTTKLAMAHAIYQYRTF